MCVCIATALVCSVCFYQQLRGSVLSIVSRLLLSNFTGEAKQRYSVGTRLSVLRHPKGELNVSLFKGGRDSSLLLLLLLLPLLLLVSRDILK